MKYVGPTYPVPSATDATNAATEWDPNTGQFVQNPDSSDATATNTAYAPATSIVDSGVANYLNKFGQITGNGWQGQRPGERAVLRGAALLPQRRGGAGVETLLTSTSVNQALDGFPGDPDLGRPIQYSCQKNFIPRHWRHLYARRQERAGLILAPPKPAKPASIVADTRPSMRRPLPTSHLRCKGFRRPTPAITAAAGSAAMVGLAYWANVSDIRPGRGRRRQDPGQADHPDAVGRRARTAVRHQQSVLSAAKYGGFITPSNLTPPHSFANTTPLDQTWWSTNGETLSGQPRPDNYFTAGNPDQMISGLTKAFQRINALSAAFTTSFSTSLPQVAQLGNASFGAQYDASNWTGEVVASELNFAADGTPSLVGAGAPRTRWRRNWRALAGTAGATVTWSGTAGVPFRTGSLTAAQPRSAEHALPGCRRDDRRQ